MRAQKGPGGWILTPKNIGRDQSHHGRKYCETFWNSDLHINRHPKIFRRQTVLAKHKHNHDHQSIRGNSSEENIEQGKLHMQCYIRINCFVRKKET
jgi:tRNA(His) 5'-end guanylyltransferase